MRMTIFERVTELEALTGAEYEAVPGAECTGDPTPEMVVLGLAALAAIHPPEAALDLTRSLEEIIGDPETDIMARPC